MTKPRWSVEAWEIPGASPFQRRVMDLPGKLVFSRPASGVGRSTLSVPKDWGRLSEILDPASDVGSLLRVIETDRAGNPQIRAEYLLRRTETPRRDAGNVVKLTAPSIEDALEWVVVYPYDWPPEIFTPNWMYGAEGAEGSYTNGDIEEFNLNGDAETGEVGPWQSTTAGADVKAPDSDLVIDTTDPRNGTYAFEVDPSGFHSGMVRRSLRVVGDRQYVFQGFLKEPATSGERFTMGIQMGAGSVLNVGAKVYNDIGLAELDGAAYQAGASDGTYQVLDATVTFGADVTETNIFFQYDEHPSGNGNLFRVDDITVTGFGIGLDPWEAVGIVDTFELDLVTFDDGVQSMKFKVGAGSGASASGPRQKVTGLVIGKTYTWSQTFTHDDVGNEPIRMAAKRPDGADVATELTQIPTGAAFTYAAVTFVADTTEVWLEARYDNAGASPNVNMDGGQFAEGLQRAPIGVIVLALLADAQTDHTGEAGDFARETLTWLKTDITALLDSAGNAWRADESLTIVRGKTYGKVFSDDFAKLGYEYRIVPNPAFGAPDTESHILQVFNPADLTTRVGGASNDLVGSVAFSGGSVLKGPVVKTPKSRTVTLAEGDALQFAVAKDAAGVTAWGARELYLAEPGVLDASTLTQAGANALVERGAAITATRLSIIDDDVFSPFIDFEPGDWVRGELPPDLPRGNHRVVAITGVIAEGNAMFDIDIGAHVFVGASGMTEAVSRLLSKFDGVGAEAGGAVATVGDIEQFTGPIEPGHLVAASDTRPTIRRLAKFKCDGVDDDEEINAAVLATFNTGTDNGGTVRLAAGNFSCGDGVLIGATKASLSLVGGGMFSTLIDADAGPVSPADGFVANLADDYAQVSDMRVLALTTGYQSAVKIGDTAERGVIERVSARIDSTAGEATLVATFWAQENVTVRDCVVETGSEGVGIYANGGFVLVENCHVRESDTQGTLTGDGILVTGDECRIVNNHIGVGIGTIAGAGIRVSGDNCVIIGNNVPDGILIDASAVGTIVGGNTGPVTDNGVRTIFLDRDDFFNGTFREHVRTVISEAGGVVTLSVDQSGGGDLSMRFSDGVTLLDTTPAKTITLTAGTDDVPQMNYIFIPQATKVLTKSTSAYPTTTEHIRVATFYVQSAANVQTRGGTVVHQIWNDGATEPSGQGHGPKVWEHLRRTRAQFFSGFDGAGTSEYLTLAGTTVDFKVTSGVVYQLHDHLVDAHDTSTGEAMLVKNWFGDPFHQVTNLFDIVDLSDGTTIGNNKWFKFVVWGVVSGGDFHPYMINVPSGFYNTQDGAEADLNGFSDFDIPREFTLDSTTGFLIAAITVKKQAAAWVFGSTQDIRGQLPAVAASGGATAGISQFSDSIFHIFNNADSTKVLELSLTGLTTATTRTWTVPDSDGTVTIDGLLLAGGTMAGTINMGGNNIINVGTLSSLNETLILHALRDTAAAGNINLFTDDSAGAAKLRLAVFGAGDIEFRKADGVTQALLWDETDNRWEFNTAVDFGGNILNTVGAIRSIDAAFQIQARSSGASAQDILLQADDSGGTLRNRMVIAGAGDVSLFKVDGATVSLLWDESDGRWEFNTPVTIAGTLHVDQNSPTAAKPVIILDQADVDEDYFKFIGTSDTNVDRALVDAANFTTPGAIVGWLKINVQDDQGTAPIVDGDYYLPFYAAPTA